MYKYYCKGCKENLFNIKYKPDMCGENTKVVKFSDFIDRNGNEMNTNSFLYCVDCHRNYIVRINGREIRGKTFGISKYSNFGPVITKDIVDDLVEE